MRITVTHHRDNRKNKISYCPPRLRQVYINDILIDDNGKNLILELLDKSLDENDLEKSKKILLKILENKQNSEYGKLYSEISKENFHINVEHITI